MRPYAPLFVKAERAPRILARNLDPQVLTPTEDGGYRITRAFHLSAPRPADPAPEVTNGSSGGLLRALETSVSVWLEVPLAA